MVSGADNVNFFTYGKKTVINPTQVGFATPTGGVQKTGANYAKYDNKGQPDYAKFDTYNSPTIKGDGIRAEKLDFMA